MHYASLTLDYMFNFEGPEYLARIEFPEGDPIYSEREIRHLMDVKSVVKAAVVIYAVALLGAISFLFLLFRRRESRAVGWRAIRDGGLLTLALLSAVGLLALTAWDVFFEGFHSVLFPPGSWQFRYTDTLIRLFPERFWMDAAMGIVIATGTGAFAVALIGWVGGLNLEQNWYNRP